MCWLTELILRRIAALGMNYEMIDVQWTRTLRFILFALSICSLASQAAEQNFSLLVLHEFDTDHPRGIVRGIDGAFYGVTAYGGRNGQGSIFRATPNGAITTIFSFNGTNGSQPSSPLWEAKNGNFYGVTQFGGNDGAGTLFQVTPGGELKTLIRFAGTNGCRPYGRLLEASDGNIYGTTTCSTIPYKVDGTVFRLTPTDSLTTLFAFNAVNDGAQPLGWLTEGSDGALYGATSLDRQSLFKITSAGVFARLAALSGTNGFGFTYLTHSRDGNFYGITGQGGAFGNGTFFRLTPDGVFTSLMSFSPETGAFPNHIIEGSDGNFYGTTRRGTNFYDGFGTVFKASPEGQITTLARFDGKNGREPLDDLAEGPDGSLYGTAFRGGKNDGGTFVRVVPTPRLSIARRGSATKLTWNSLAGTLYRVESKTTLYETNWVPITGKYIATGDSSSLEVNGKETPEAYYRVMLVR